MRTCPKSGSHNSLGSLHARESRCRCFRVKLYGSGETCFAGARAFGAVRLDAKHYAFTSQRHPEAGILQFGEQNVELDERSDWRQFVRKDVDPGRINVTGHAFAVLRLSILVRPREERLSAQPVAFGFSQFYITVHGIVAFTPSATGQQRN